MSPVTTTRAAARAIEAAVQVAHAYGVRSDDPSVLADGANVVVHLRPEPLVAKVAATTRLVREPAQWLERELAVATHLASAGIPVVVPSDLVPPVVHAAGSHSMTFWQHLPHDPAAQIAPATLGGMLRDLHEALRSCELELPRLVTPLEDVRRFLDRADPATSAGMRRAFDRALDGLPRDLPDQVLHGDPHPGNTLLATGGWTWADLEDTCAGPVAWDLACVATNVRVDAAEALRAYGPVPDLAPWIALRRLHAAAWTCLYAERLPHHRAPAEALLASWK